MVVRDDGLAFSVVDAMPSLLTFWSAMSVDCVVVRDREE